MATYLSFLDEAIAYFDEAFQLYEQNAADAPKDLDLRKTVRAVMVFYVALEKGLKHTLAKTDPYLLIMKPDRKLLLELRQDLLAESAPSIFCSRRPFETLSLAATWETLRELHSEPAEPQVITDFDRALKRLIEIRHRAQHGELNDDASEVHASLRQLLARFGPVASSLAPEWLSQLHSRNGQLDSRLRALELEVDADWQVLVDYLTSNGPFHVRDTLFAELTPSGESVSVIFGNASNQPNAVAGGADVLPSDAVGDFTAFLTASQAEQRYAARMAEDPAESGGVPAGIKALRPVNGGTLRLPRIAVWIRLHLPNIEPHGLFTSASMPELVVKLSPEARVGSVTGRLESAVKHPTVNQPAVQIAGQAYLESEWHRAGDPDADPPTNESTVRCLILDFDLFVPPAG